MRRDCPNALSRTKKGQRYQYESVEEEIVASPEWPPVSRSSSSVVDLLRMESAPSGIQTANIKINNLEKEPDQGLRHRNNTKEKEALPLRKGTLESDAAGPKVSMKVQNTTSPTHLDKENLVVSADSEKGMLNRGLSIEEDALMMKDELAVTTSVHPDTGAKVTTL